MTTPTSQNMQDFGRKLAQIRADRDLSEEAERRMIAEAYEKGSKRRRELVADYERDEAEKPPELDGHAVQPAQGA